MTDKVLELFPATGAQADLTGLYLQHRLHAQPTVQRPFIYSNFISSLDGRIGLPRPGSNTHQVPPAIANPRDWRLFQELAAQADLLLTSARYFRQFEGGTAQDHLPIGNGKAFADLRSWRLQEGLQAQPDIAILSSSLDLPANALQAYRQRNLIVVTGQDADAGKIKALEKLGIRIVLAGSHLRVEGGALAAALGELGYRSLYAIGGPQVLHTLAVAGVLDRLYLTMAQRLLGGERFDTLNLGSELDPPLDLQLVHLYLDTTAPAGAGQLLSVFDRSDRQKQPA